MAKKSSTSSKSSSSSTHNDCPKRPLSAYNMFFQLARQRVVGVDNLNEEQQDSSKQHGPYTRAEIFAANFDKNNGERPHKQRPHRRVHGRISFIDLAKTISSQWNALPTEERRLFEERADEEKRKYAVELEEWLIKQSPTPQIKKRLGALRRGALGKFIKAHHREHNHKEHQGTQEEPRKEGTKIPPNYQERNQKDSTSTPMMSPSPRSSYANPRPTSFALAPRRVSNDREEGPYYHHPQSGRNLQMQRARNLERLYRMQIQLYEEQVRLHEESCAVSSHQEYNMLEDYHPHHPQAPPPPPRPMVLKPTPPILSHHAAVSPPTSPPYYRQDCVKEVHYVRGYPQDHPTSYVVPNITTCDDNDREPQPWHSPSSRLLPSMTSSSFPSSLRPTLDDPAAPYHTKHNDHIDNIMDDNESFSHPQELACWQEAEEVEDNLDDLILAPIHDDDDLPPLPLVGSESILLGDFGLVAVDPFATQD